MVLEQELKREKIVYFLKKEQEILLVLAEKGGIFKCFPCPIDFNDFTNIYNVLCLGYTVCVDFTSRYNVKLLGKNKVILASFSSPQFLAALSRLEEGIGLYFEQKGNNIVRK